MTIVLWLAAGMLAAAFAATGMMKLARPYTKLTANPNMGWVADFTPAQVKLIGLVELLAAVGVILPPLVNTAAWLVSLAAAGLVLDMIGAFATHLRRDDPNAVRTVTLVLGALALFVAVGRLWIAPF